MKRHFLTALLAGLALAGAVTAADKPADEVQDVIFLAESRPVLVRLHIEADGKPYHKLWSDFVHKVFVQYDRNKDGKLDQKEAVRLPSPSSLFGGQPFVYNLGGEVSKVIPADLDRNGTVTEQELGEYFARQGGPAFGMTTNASSGLPYRVVGAGGNERSTTRLNAALFKLLDADRNGPLSARELGDAPARLAKLDANEDEMLTPEELLNEPSNEDGEYFLIDSGGAGEMAPGDNPLVAVSRSGKRIDVADRLLSRYAGKSSTVTREQIGLDADDFKALDRTGDDKLDRKELQGYVSRSPDVEIKVALGQKAKVELVTDPKKAAAWGAELSTTKEGGTFPAAPPGSGVRGGRPRNKDQQDAAVEVQIRRSLTSTDSGERVRFKLGSSEFTLGIWSDYGAITFASVNAAEVWKMQFTQADADNNGYIDEKEAKGNPLFAIPFKQMDADGDGMVYLKEVLAWAKENEALQTEARQACVTLAVSDQGEGLFELLDTSKDRRLGERELRKAGRLLSLLDGNKDGLVDQREVPRSYTLSLRRGPAGSGSLFGAIALVATDRATPVAEKGSGPTWFHKMDRNGDGDVSPREFLGSPELFRKLDRDGDRLISEAEAHEAEPRKP